MYNTSGMRRSRIVLLIAAVMSCLALAPAARAADPPIPQMATTEPATGVTSTTAVLNGRIDTGGAAVIWHFEYGLSQNYDSTTPPQRIDPGSQTVNVTSTLTGGSNPAAGAERSDSRSRSLSGPRDWGTTGTTDIS